MRYLICVFLILFALQSNIAGQGVPANVPEVLGKLYTRLIDNGEDADRLRINDSIITIIDSYVASDSIFKHRFTNLRYLGQITSPDKQLKIVTWNLVLSNNSGRYYCYFIRKPNSGKKNRVYKLTSSYNSETVRIDTVYSETGWYGTLYYDLKPFVSEKKKSWVLLGIDYGNPVITRKVIETLSFSDAGDLIFGRKWFVTDKDVRYRDVFEYGVTGKMTLRFFSEKSIVFDHLVPFSSPLQDDRQNFGSSFSFDSYTFKNGFWKLSTNVDTRNK